MSTVVKIQEATLNEPHEAKSNDPGSDLDWRDSSWLLAEYTTLSNHYFHEDNYYLRTVGLYGTLNAALLTLFGSNLISGTEKTIHWSFIFVGAAMTIAWAVSLVRVRHLRRRCEDRIAEIEHSINAHWQASGNEPPFAMLKIRNRNDTAKGIQKIPVSIIMLLFPGAFAVVWLALTVKLLLSPTSAPFWQ